MLGASLLCFLFLNNIINDDLGMCCIINLINSVDYILVRMIMARAPIVVL